PSSSTRLRAPVPIRYGLRFMDIPPSMMVSSKIRARRVAVSGIRLVGRDADERRDARLAAAVEVDGDAPAHPEHRGVGPGGLLPRPSRHPLPVTGAARGQDEDLALLVRPDHHRVEVLVRGMCARRGTWA